MLTGVCTTPDINRCIMQNYKPSPMINKIRTSALLILLVVMNACQDENLVRPRTVQQLDNSAYKLDDSGLIDHTIRHNGPAVPFAKGVVKAFVLLDKDGMPVSVGISFSARILNNLPDEPTEISVSLPQQWTFLPFNHVTLGWNPHGHPPPGIYQVPHFDIHFYMITEEEQLAIPGIAPPYMDPAPAANYIPPAYVQGPGLEQHMGAHWVDVLAPEFNGGQFTKTMVMGSYNANFIFYEPMMTLSYLQSKPDETLPIRQPAAYQLDGYHPTSYRVSYEEQPNEYIILLTGLVWREAD
jgi:hypothetical protein